MAEKRKFNAQRAEEILSKTPCLTEVGKKYHNIRVGNITYEKSEGVPFVWDNSGEEYAIVNLRASNPELMQMSADLLAEGNFEDASNLSLSINLPVEEADELSPGDIVSLITNEYYSEKYECDMLGVAKLLPVEDAKKVLTPFQKMLAKSRAKAEQVKLTP